MIRTAYTRWHEMEQIFRNNKNKKKVINIIVKFMKTKKCPQLINSPCIVTAGDKSTDFKTVKTK